MTPLGMAVSLQQDENPHGRIYFSGYGNSVSYYDYLLRHFSGGQSREPFREYTRVMLGEDRAYPTQSAVFCVGFEDGADAPPDVKIEFCGHCLFDGDVEARDRCLEWLTLRNINPHAYTDQLEVLAGQMSPTKVNTHVYLGLGWKKQQEYTTIYLKPHPDSGHLQCITIARRIWNARFALSVDYVLSRQHADGSWVDWELPPGQSSTWTTAYVGGKLTESRSHHRDRAANATARRIAMADGENVS